MSKKITKKQIDEFKERFLSQKQAILDSYHGKKENEMALELDIDGDETDIVQGNILFSIEEKLSIRDTQRMTNIQKALKRIKDGEFGNCIECNEVIGKARLEAIPEAELCIKCAEIQEKEFKNFIKK